MTQFQFRLQTLLKLRISYREQRQAELAEAQRAAGILQQRWQQLELELADAQRQAREAGSAGEVNVDRVAAVQRHAWLLQASLRTLGQQRGQLDEEIERRRTALMEADRQVRVLEKLREHQQLDYSRQELLRLQKELDDQPRQWHTALTEG